MDVSFPQFRARLTSSTETPTIYLIDKRGHKFGSGVPASKWELLLWDELESLRGENLELRRILAQQSSDGVEVLLEETG